MTRLHRNAAESTHLASAHGAARPRDADAATEGTASSIAAVPAREALLALESFRGPALIDLDETLYLRNSTEDFIDCATPGLLALLLLRALDLLQPWRWTGGLATRDVWRVNAIRWLLPWTRLRWQRRLRRLAVAHGNGALIETLRERARDSGAQPPVTILTDGFAPVVRPLLAAMGLGDLPCVAASAGSFRDRAAGKLARARGQLGTETVSASLVLTDSKDDLPLLEACARPLLVRWPEARFRPALSRVYLPGQYLSQVKRPGERYIVRGILQEDFAFWILASIGLAALPWLHLAGLSLLLLSFWTVYEMGYVDNDRCGARYEREPKLSRAYHEQPVATPRIRPWIWALTSGAAAIWLLRQPGSVAPADFLAWGAVLLGTHGFFRLYNRVDKQSRVWLFGGLQFARTAAFAALVPITAAGSAALGAHVISRWMPYFFYRLGGREWPSAPFSVARLLFFVLLMVLMLPALGTNALLHWSAPALLAWNLYRARRELVAALRAFRRIDGASSSASRSRPQIPT